MEILTEVAASKSTSNKEVSSVPIALSGTHVPVLSIIVPVFNVENKIESTLQTLNAKMEHLEAVAAKLDTRHRLSKLEEKKNANKGRRVIENADADLLLDKYLESYSPDGTKRSNSSDISKGSNGNDNNSDVKKENSFDHGIASSGFSSSILSHFDNERSWYEIVVVNDGSSDDTRGVVQSILKTDNRIRLISYSINMGKGYAIRQGVLHSYGKYVMFMDGDGEISSDVLARYLEGLENADIVIGSKNHPLSAVKAPLSRKLLSKGFQFFVRALLGIKVHDTQVGLKMGRADLFRKIFARVLVKRYAFDAEMLAIATLLDARITEMPVEIYLEKSFKKKEIIRMAIDVLGVAFRLKVVKWYQKNMEKQRPFYKGLPFI
jgi:dolichol-phosphate mannosyltransferase